MAAIPDIYEYKIYCNTENALKTCYSTSAPTTCPVDTSHSVNSSVGPGVLITNRPQSVVDGSPDIGFFQASTITITIPPPVSVPAEIVVDTVFPFDMYIWEMSICQDSSNIRDTLSVELGPDTPIGVLLQNASIGDTILYCSSTVAQNISRGCELGVWNGDLIKEYPGRVTAINLGTGAITVETPLVNNYGVGSPILFSCFPVRNLVCDSNQRINIGNKGLKAKVFPAGTVVRLIYTDNTPNENTTYAFFQILYYHA
jgi:hypothetical protein